MNKKLLVIACLIITTMAFSGCGLSGGDKNQEAAKEGTGAEQNQEVKKSDKNDNKDGNYFETMKDLMARGKNMKCTYTQDLDEKDAEMATGVVYMADKNARVEITVKGKNRPDAKMYSLIKQDWMYSWTEGSSAGYKMTMEVAEMSDEDEQNMASLSKEIEFECKSWKKDNSKFNVPTDINFQDMTEMMRGLEIPSEEEMEDIKAQGNKLICDLCKNAPASEMKECLGDVVCDWSE